jgi:hypothetical protein
METTIGFFEISATVCFALAIIHTFMVKRILHFSHSFGQNSVGENLFHLLGEVEVVFGLWAGIFVGMMAINQGGAAMINYLETRNFTEPAFVFVIMAICSTKPILTMASMAIESASKLVPLKRPVAFYASALVLGPLLGSFITEPAAMTVTALILLERFYQRGISLKLMYATIGLLFVNISIGGTLTSFAAPPVLMVASIWNWDMKHMALNFGWKGALACIISTAFVVYRFRNELAAVPWDKAGAKSDVPVWVKAVHLIFLVLVVITAHHMVVFMGVFLFFLGLFTVTRRWQRELKLKEGLLVGFFLGGLVILGGPQRWWLEPILNQLSALPLFLGSMGLTAIMDNAAITFLGAQVPTISEASKYALVSGAVVGGGLTVIANAPNPAGYGILNSSFGKEGISPVGLLLAALPPTFVAACCYWFLP